MTHTFTTGTTPYTAVMGTGEEEIPHLQSIACTYKVYWGKGLPVCGVLDLQLMTHNVKYSSTFFLDVTPTLPTKHSNLIKHSSSCIWRNTNNIHLHRRVPHSGKIRCLHLQGRRKLESPYPFSKLALIHQHTYMANNSLHSTTAKISTLSYRECIILYMGMQIKGDQFLWRSTVMHIF